MSSIKYFFIGLLLSGCVVGGTEAGNPNLGYNASQTNQLGRYLVESICTRLHDCAPAATLETCKAGFLETTALPERLGLSPGFGTVAEMITAEASTAIHADYNSALQCHLDIQSLACTSIEVTTAYNPAIPDDFTNAAEIIPASSTACPKVF